MKMKIEKAKSVVLALLVFLSLILTWSLWTFQPQYDFRLKANNLQNVAIGEKRQFNEVIKPTQFIFHQSGLHYAIIDEVLSNQVYQSVMDLNVLGYEYITFTSKAKLQSFFYQDSSFEMIFPVNLPINISNYLMGPIRQEWDINYFDRIFVTFSKNPAIYYISSAHDQAIKLNIEDNELNIIKGKLLKNNNHQSTYFTIKGNQDETLYLPENRIILEQMTFSNQKISSSEFINVLFSDPNGVKQHSLNNGEESYTDGSSALEVSQDQSMMRFINPANPEVYDMEPGEMILKSIEFINDHSGWTDSFSLMDWNKNNQVVNFRLMVDGHPVFSDGGATTIYQSWRDNEIYEYIRSLTNLRFSIDSEQKKVALPSGRELLSYLAQSKQDFTLNSLEAALVGYNFTNDNVNPAVATVKPSWYIKYDGKWEQIVFPDMADSQGGSKLGLE